MQIDDDSVHISGELQGLFPAGVVVAETRALGLPGTLLPDEAACLGAVVPRRAQEYAAGRSCGRRALAEFGIAGFPIRVGAKREPLWPEGYVGSISHTDGFCAAAVGERSRFLGLGLDVEQSGRVNALLQTRICVPAERDWLAARSAAEASAAATLLFAAKEAFYKAQFPLTGEWLYFEDAAVELPEWPAPAGRWLLTPLRPMAIERQGKFPLRGDYRLDAQFVFAGVAIT